MTLVPLLLMAAAFWGQTPACGQPSITTRALPADPGLELLGPEVHIVELATPRECLIEVDPSQLKFAGSACMAVFHGYGHLLGYDDPVGFRWPNGTIDHTHSPDPNNVMYPVMRRALRPCRW